MKLEPEEVNQSTMGYHNYTDSELINIAIESAPHDSVTYQLALRLERARERNNHDVEM